MRACCTGTPNGSGRFFARFAHRYRRRYRRRGLDRTQRHMVALAEAHGLAGASLLEAGCGVGYLQQTLLARGAATAVGIDLAPSMVAEARLGASEAGLAGRTSYEVGDFATLSGGLAPADVTLLDRVVCCDPEGERLVRGAARLTRRFMVLTYPRDHVLNRVGVWLLAGLLRCVGSAYRPYVYPQAAIAGWLGAEGLVPDGIRTTAGWRTEVYRR